MATVDNLEILSLRKGAKRRSEIPAAVVAALNRGELETVNLVEFLVIDQIRLLKSVLTNLGIDQPVHRRRLIAAANAQTEVGIMRRTAEIGRAFFATLAEHPDLPDIYSRMVRHPSDTVRCWAAYMDTANQALSFAGRLKRVKPFAEDDNPGVREIAWISVREIAAEPLVEEIERLHSWAKSRNPRIRRFAIEITRPRGVWCRHLAKLKTHPEVALPLLSICREDPEKYVQDSVANWLNDASKTRADFVLETCRQWQAESDSRATARITHRALRTLRKQATEGVS
ncbi:MAG: DNA alkylation repair protein [Pirellulaceae bacterium]